MSRTWTISVEHISVDEMRELMWFCRGYRRKKREAEALLTLRISTPPPTKGKKGPAFMPRGKGGVPSSPVETAARKRARYLRDVDMIDRAAALAAAEYADAGNSREHLARLLVGVVSGEVSATWAIGRCSLGRNRFYAMRRLFFSILAGMRAK